MLQVTNQSEYDTFCEIIELYWSHECYTQAPITCISDVYKYLIECKTFVTKEVLNRLFTKDQTAEFSVLSIKIE